MSKPTDKQNTENDLEHVGEALDMLDELSPLWADHEFTHVVIGQLNALSAMMQSSLDILTEQEYDDSEVDE
ncbi:MAG: hypothetical protein AAF126_01930 [Chloroflexota bacterium]